MSQERRGQRQAPGAEFDAFLDAAVRACPRGGVLLVEVLPPWPLQLRWLEYQLGQLAAGAVVHSANESLVALIIADTTATELWALQDVLRARASEHHVRLFAGAATWPLQGSTATDLVAAAAASLIDDHAREDESLADELWFDFDGKPIPLGCAGELLTG